MFQFVIRIIILLGALSTKYCFQVSEKELIKLNNKNVYGDFTQYGNYKSQHGASVVRYKFHHKFITVALKKTIKGNYNKRNNKEKIKKNTTKYSQL